MAIYDDDQPIVNDSADLIPGVKGTDQTVKEMIRLVRSGMQSKEVQSIASSLKSQSDSDVELYLACHEYVVKHIKYVHDEWKGKEAEVVASARLTLTGKRPYGDCDDMVVALATLLKLNKIDVKIKVIAWKKQFKDQYTHVYLLADMKSLKLWVPADPVRDATLGKSGFGWEVAPVYMRKTYNV